jgi:hypothetical protein
MTTQHAPHTPPLWRKFLSLPQTGIGWAAVGLAGLVWALWLFGIIATLLNGDAIGWEGVLFGLFFSAPLLIPGAVAGLIALLLNRDRSLLVWLTMVSYLLSLAVVLMFIGREPEWLIMITLPVAATLAVVVLERVRRRRER